MALAAGTLLAAPAMAYCSKPIEPHCAVRGETMGNSYTTAKACHRRVEDHIDKLARYQICLQGMIEDSERESLLYKNLLAGADAAAEPETEQGAETE